MGVKSKKITKISPPVKGVLLLVATLFLCFDVSTLSKKILFLMKNSFKIKYKIYRKQN